MIDVRDKVVQNRMGKAKEMARTTNKPPREIYAEALSGAPDEVVVRFPKASAFGRGIRNERKGDGPKAPKTLAELVLAPTTTTTGEEFIMFDNGKDAKGRIIMFATKKSMEFLATGDTIFMDETVSSAPVLFNQVYTIHGMIALLIFVSLLFS